MPTFYTFLSIYIYIYIYILSLRRNKIGLIRIINLFPSCYVFLIKSKNTKKKLTGLLQNVEFFCLGGIPPNSGLTGPNNIYIYIYICWCIYIYTYIYIYTNIFVKHFFFCFLYNIVFFFVIFVCLLSIRLCLYIYIHFLSNFFSTYGRCPHGVVVKPMDCGIVVSEFVLQSRYYVYFRTNTLGEKYEPSYTPNYGLYSTTTVLLGKWLWH